MRTTASVAVSFNIGTSEAQNGKRDDLRKKKYLQNAYRVLLTRARQGLVILTNGEFHDPRDLGNLMMAHTNTC